MVLLNACIANGCLLPCSWSPFLLLCWSFITSTFLVAVCYSTFCLPIRCCLLLPCHRLFCCLLFHLSSCFLVGLSFLLLVDLSPLLLTAAFLFAVFVAFVTTFNVRCHSFCLSCDCSCAFPIAVCCFTFLIAPCAPFLLLLVRLSCCSLLRLSCCFLLCLSSCCYLLLVTLVTAFLVTCWSLVNTAFVYVRCFALRFPCYSSCPLLSSRRLLLFVASPS